MTINKAYRIVFNEWKDSPGWINLVEKVFGEKVALQADEWHGEYLKQIKDAETHFYKVIKPANFAYIKKLREANKEIIEKKKQERRVLMERMLKDKKENLNQMLNKWGNLKEKEQLYKEAEDLEKKLNSRITDEMIEEARHYPIESIVEVDHKGWATCVFHSPDVNPSMYCKNGYAYCFSCHESSDPIKLYMQVNNCDFIEAVKSLTNNI